MKKRFIKFYSMILVSLLLLAACGGSNSAPTTNVSENTSAAGTESAATTAESEDLQTTEAQGEQTTASADQTTTTAQSTSAAASKEPVIIKMYHGTEVRSSLENDFGQKIYNDIGVEIQLFPLNTSSYENAALMLAAQSWGDIDIVNTQSDEVTKQYIEAGLLVNLDDYKDKLTNFYSYNADWIPYVRLNDEKNNGLYTWELAPDQQQMTALPLDMITRVDALEICGWPDLDTTDDYIAFLKEAVEKIPESNGMKTIGMSCFWGEASSFAMFPTYLARHGGMAHPFKMWAYVDPVNGTFVEQPSSPYLKDALMFYNTLFREGLLDREAWTDGFSQLQEKMDSGVPIIANFMNWGVSQANVKAVERGQPEMQYIVTPIRLSYAKEDGRNTRYEYFSMTRIDEQSGILSTSPNIERIIELLDYVANEDMTIMAGWGIEGVDWTRNGDKIVSTSAYIDGINGSDSEEFRWSRGVSNAYWHFPMRNLALMSNGQPGIYYNDPGFINLSATDVQQNAYKNLGWDNPLSGLKENPHFKFEPFDLTNYNIACGLVTGTDMETIDQRITDYLYQQIPLIINASTEAEFESLYKDMVDNVATMGISELITFVNERLAEINSKIETLKNK